MKIRDARKYEFLRKADALRYINELYNEDGSRKTYQVEQTDENGDVVMVDKPYIAHVVVIGFIPTEFDADGVATAFADKYSVDVLWESEIEARWNTYEIQVEGKGIHEFR